MKKHLNTLFVTTQGAYLSRQGQAVVVRVDGREGLRVPVHMLGSIVCFGRVGCSPYLLGLCGEQGVAVSFLTENGRFLARAHGFTSGNVLLRREQYRRADDGPGAARIAPAAAVPVQAAVAQLDRCLGVCARDVLVDALRGTEGEAARAYFAVFDHLVVAQKEDFAFRDRSRRPPLDRMNALLSFLYAMLANDTRAACEAAGLDPAVGFLHADRPGRAGLALDLMEEFRAFLADRLALSLVNRRQVQGSGFRTGSSGGVEMDDETRRTVLSAYQRRKQEEIRHPFLGEATTVGLLPHLQARLLARHLRGDLDGYPPFIWK